jgi:hypothetical protein
MLDLFRLVGGIDLQAEDLSSNANILQGAGVPGGDSGEQDAAPRGSIYLMTGAETNHLQLFYKWTTVNNSAADWRQSASKDYVDAVAQGLSWRAPVRVIDTTVYANVAAFPTSGTIDSVPLNAGDRVLFANVTAAGENNVYIWDGTTWTEDVNQESDGDAVLVQVGSKAETQWVFDGTNWVQFGGAASQAELSFIRDYIGKTGPGAENPTYSSTNVITQSSTLETAIGALDAVNGDGEITNDVADNVGTLYALSDNLTQAGGALTVTDALNELNNAIGDKSYTQNNVVIDGESTAASIEKLDIAVGSLYAQGDTINLTNVNVTVTPVTVDTIDTSAATEVKWLIQVRETSTPANRQASEIHALTNGTTVDFTRYGVLKIGSAIAGLVISSDINAGSIRLRVKATNNLDIVVKRIGYSAF